MKIMPALALLATAPLQASLAPIADTAAYPELAIEAFLPALITGLKRNLPDAYSVRDLVVCDAQKVKLEGNRPVSWSVSFALNAKNAVGGYTGMTSYFAVFKQGKVTMVVASSLPGKGGLDGLISRSIMKRIATCRPIPQATVQALLETAPAL